MQIKTRCPFQQIDGQKLKRLIKSSAGQMWVDRFSTLTVGQRANEYGLSEGVLALSVNNEDIYSSRLTKSTPRNLS